MNNYSDEKLQFIKSLSDATILAMINEIKGESRTRLNNDVLKAFVLEKHKAIKNDNTKKYGDETKEHFCKALKGEEDKKSFFSNSNITKKITPQEKATSLLPLIFICWLSSNEELQNQNIENIIKSCILEDENNNWNVVIHDLINENKNNYVSKETIQTIYNFCPILPDNKLQLEIEKCKTRYDINTGNFKEKQKEMKSLEAQNKKHLNTITEKNEEIKQLKQQLSEKNNYEKQYNELNIKYNELLTINKMQEQQLKQAKSTNTEKLKEHLQKQLTDKDNKIKELSEKFIDYEQLKEQNYNLTSQNATLQTYKTMNLKQLYANIENNKEYQHILKQLILSDKKTCDLIIKKLNLKEVIVQEISARKEQILLESSDELKILQNKKESLSKEINESIEFLDEINEKHSNISSDITTNENTIEVSKVNFVLPTKEPAMFDYISFQADFLAMCDNNDEIYNKKLCKKLCNEQIVIINKFDEFKTWYRCQDYDFDPLIVIPEFDWTSYKDWFGYFDNNKFIPSNTLVSDYYKLLKENSDIPLGIIVIKDFNKILPDIYLEYFIEKITEKITPGIYMAHPTQSLSENDEVFRHVTLLENLKFILVKADSPKAFDIPISMKKFEVNTIE